MAAKQVSGGGKMGRAITNVFGGAKGGGVSMNASPQFSADVKVGSAGSFGPVSPKTPANTSSFDTSPLKPVLSYNPVVQSPKQAAYVEARQTATPARGQEVTLKGVNDGWAGKKAVAQGFDNTGASQRYNPVQPPKQAAYVNARQGQPPARGQEVSIKGVNDSWGGTRAVGRGGGIGGGIFGIKNR
jgi:hypothetical protein